MEKACVCSHALKMQIDEWVQFSLPDIGIEDIETIVGYYKDIPNIEVTAES